MMVPAGIEIIECRVGNPKGIVKSWILHEERATIIVDAGQDHEDAQRISNALARLGRTVDHVQAILVTHRHGDHTGGLPSLTAGSTAEVFAHRADREHIVDNTGISVEELVIGPLSGIPDVEVIHMPGHTPGTIALFWRSRATLIAGDAIFSAGGHLISPPDYLCDDPDMARQSVARLVAENLPIDVVLVSHGEDVLEGGKARLQRTQVARREDRR